MTAKKVFMSVDSAIVYLYGILNIIAMTMYFLSSSSENAVYERIITMDLYTWHVFGVFAIASFIFKLCAKEKLKSDSPFAKFLKTDIVLHAVFTAVSAVCIIFLFNRTF